MKPGKLPRHFIWEQSKNICCKQDNGGGGINKNVGYNYVRNGNAE